MFRRFLASVLAGALMCAAPLPLPAETPTVPTAKRKAQKPKKPRTLTYKQLAKAIDKVLADPELQRGLWGIHVLDATTGNTVYEQNPDRLFTPASNTKLFTTASAFALLGPQYKLQTTIETNGVLDSIGKLTGDLFIVGRGDPNLSGRVLPYGGKTERQPPHLRALEQLADTLVGAGLKEIDGDIVGDDTYFAFERYGNGWMQDDLMWSDGAPASALTINDNSIYVSVTPGEVGGAAKLVVDPDVNYYEIDNRVTTIPLHSGKREIAMDRQPGAKRLTIWGTIPADDIGWSQAIAIDDPAEYAAVALKEMLQKRGVTFHGTLRAAHTMTSQLPIYALDVSTANQHAEHGGADARTETPAPKRTVLASLDSRPLGDDFVVTNKVSQNLHAELMLRLIGHEHAATSSLESALAAEKDFLVSIGLDEKEFEFYDGSGMSAHNLVSPRAITKLLLWTEHQPWAQQFRDSLPIAGVDGSLDSRFRDTVARGRVWAKTGTLTNTNALSGFAQTESGRNLVFSVLVNHHGLTSGGAKKVIDHIIELLVDDQTGRPAVRSAGAR